MAGPATFTSQPTRTLGGAECADKTRLGTYFVPLQVLNGLRARYIASRGPLVVVLEILGPRWIARVWYRRSTMWVETPRSASEYLPTEGPAV